MRLEVFQLDLCSTFGGGGDLADHPRLFARFTQYVQRGLDVLLSHADHHAHAAVQYAVHFVFFDVALLLQPVEHGRTLPAGDVDHGLGALWQNARDIVQQTATGDVGHGLDGTGFLDELEQRLDVDAGRRHQQFGQRLAVELDVFDVGTGHFDDLADQRVTVGVWAGGRQCQQGIARGNLGTVNDFSFLVHADAEAGQS